MSIKPPHRWYAAASMLHNAYTAWIVLALSVVVTIGAYVVSSNVVEQRRFDRFLFSAKELEKSISNHLQVYEQVLRSTVAMLYASDNLDREGFGTYVRGLSLNQYWPGIQGIGYSIPLRPDQVAGHVESVRAEGFPEFRISPPGERDVYSSILYLEPFDWRNRRAFGYDMYSNSVRREAMDRARRTGHAAMSGKITLVQETNQDVQSGFLTYLPVYSSKSTPATEAEREAQFEGWVYAPFRAGDLMAGVTSGDSFMLEFEIYDGDLVSDASLLYSSRQMSSGAMPASSPADELLMDQKLLLQGRPWVLRIRSAPGFVANDDQANLPRYIAMVGVVVDLLLFYVLLSLHFVKQKAERLVKVRTSELQNIQVELERERTFANSVIDSLPLILFVKDASSEQLLRVNPYTRAVFGMESDRPTELLSRFVNRVEKQGRMRSAEGRSAYIGQFDVETESGTRWFVVNSSRLEGLGSHAVEDQGLEKPSELQLCSAIDVTERFDSEKRFTTLFDSAPCGLMLVASDQTIQLANQTLCNIFGYLKGELIGQPISILMPEELRDLHSRRVAEYSMNPDSRIMRTRQDFRGITKQGKELVLDIALQPLPYDHQQYVLVSVNDITEQYQLMRALEQANRYKTEFLASMSHELRTPLNAIIGFTNRVIKGAGEALGERELDALQTVQRNANHLLALINDILDLTKVESGRLELTLEVCEISRVLDIQLQTLAPSARAKGLQFSTTLPETPVVMVTDKGKLIQILNNLVSNAVKYTHEGEVSVSLELIEDDQTLLLTVSDTGIGIPERELGSLFKEFVRMKEARRFNIEGTGLGLVISARLAEMLGGKITAQSQHGEGSVFSVYLPVKRDLTDHFDSE